MYVSYAEMLTRIEDSYGGVESKGIEDPAKKSDLDPVINRECGGWS